MLIIIVKPLQPKEQKFREAKELAGAMQPVNGRTEVTPPLTVCPLLSTQAGWLPPLDTRVRVGCDFLWPTYTNLHKHLCHFLCACARASMFVRVCVQVCMHMCVEAKSQRQVFSLITPKGASHAHTCKGPLGSKVSRTTAPHMAPKRLWSGKSLGPTSCKINKA